MRILIYFLSLLSACSPQPTCDPIPAFNVNGHRGLRGLYPENSLYGFENTIEKGYYKLELDLILTADSQLVIFHDPDVGSDLCEVGKDLPIFDYTYAELKNIVCGTKKNWRFPKQEKVAHAIPLLHDFLQMCQSHPLSDSLLYIMEIKSPQTYKSRMQPNHELLVQLFLDEVKGMGADEKTVLQSFDPKVLEAFRKADKRIPVLFLLDKMKSVDIALNQLSFQPEICGLNHRLITREVVEEFHARNISVTAWTVNSPQRIEALRCMGVDDVMSDYFWSKE